MMYQAASKSAGLFMLALVAIPIVSSTPVPGPSLPASEAGFNSGEVDGTTGSTNSAITPAESDTAVLSSMTSATVTATVSVVENLASTSITPSTAAPNVPTQSSVVAGLLGFTNTSSQKGLDYLTYAFEEDGLDHTSALTFAEVIQFQSNVWKDLNSRFQDFQTKQIITIALLIGAIAAFIVCGLIYSLYQCISCCRRRRQMRRQRRLEERNSFTMVSPSSSTLKRGISGRGGRNEKFSVRPSTAPSGSGRFPIDTTPKSQAPSIGLGIITPISEEKPGSFRAEVHELTDRNINRLSSPTPSGSSQRGPRYIPSPSNHNHNNANPRSQGLRPSSTAPAGVLSLPPVLPSTITTSPSFASSFSTSAVGAGSSAPPPRLTIKHLPPSGLTSPTLPNFPMPNAHAHRVRPSTSGSLRPGTATTLSSIGESSNTLPSAHAAATAAQAAGKGGRISDILAEFDFDVDEDNKENDVDRDEESGVLGDGESQVGILGGGVKGKR